MVVALSINNSHVARHLLSIEILGRHLHCVWIQSEDLRIPSILASTSLLGVCNVHVLEQFFLQWRLQTRSHLLDRNLITLHISNSMSCQSCRVAGNQAIRHSALLDSEVASKGFA